MAPIAAAACLLVLGATGDLALDTEVHLSTGVRRTVLGSSPLPIRLDTTSGETELAPRIKLSRDGRLNLSIGYAPRLLVPVDVSGGSPELRDWTALQRRAVVLHDGRIDAHARMDTWTVGGTARGSYGEWDLLTRGEGAGQPVVTAARIPYRSGEASASVSGEPSRRTSYSVQGGAYFTGGADDSARKVLPTQRELRLSSTLEWNATRRDVLAALLSGTGSRIDSVGDAAYLRAGGGWRHLVRPTLAVRGATGLAATFARTPAAHDTTRGAVPWLEASVAYMPDGPRPPPSAELRLAVEPAIDRVSGAVDARGAAIAIVGWRPAPVWLLEAQASFAALRGWDGLDTFTSRGGTYVLVGKGELRATRRVRERLSISAVVRYGAQRTDRQDLPGFRQTEGFLELTAGTVTRLYNGRL